MGHHHRRKIEQGRSSFLVQLVLTTQHRKFGMYSADVTILKEITRTRLVLTNAKAYRS